MIRKVHVNTQRDSSSRSSSVAGDRAVERWREAQAKTAAALRGERRTGETTETTTMTLTSRLICRQHQRRDRDTSRMH